MCYMVSIVYFTITHHVELVWSCPSFLFFFLTFQITENSTLQVISSFEDKYLLEISVFQGSWSYLNFLFFHTLLYTGPSRVPTIFSFFRNPLFDRVLIDCLDYENVFRV